jgi:hypothetical protein
MISVIVEEYVAAYHRMHVVSRMSVLGLVGPATEFLSMRESELSLTAPTPMLLWLAV